MSLESASSPEKTGTPLVRREVVGAGIGVGVADTPEGLSAIHRPGCAAALWRRHTPAAFQSWIDSLDPKHLPHGRMPVDLASVRSAADALCDQRGTPEGAMREHLVDDIAALANIFAGLMDTDHLQLRLEAVTSNACARFHIDAVTARLICTYRGTGTQYGVMTDADAPRRVFTVPTGAPIILRGTLWPDSPPAGVVHRSPPIEGTGETRLVLVLDPLPPRPNG
ncbi:MAG: DUF1826 domain-containing protein [Pseudomonadota bacterium]